jgi:hypothetical protein
MLASFTASIVIVAIAMALIYLAFEHAQRRDLDRRIARRMRHARLSAVPPLAPTPESTQVTLYEASRPPKPEHARRHR